MRPRETWTYSGAGSRLGESKSLGTVERGEWDEFVRLDKGVEIFSGWMGMDADGIIDRATPIEGVPFVRLEDVLAFKRCLGRVKNRDPTRLIENHLSRE